MRERNYRHLYVQGSIPEFENDGDEMDKYYLPLRALGFAVNRDGEAMVIVPESDSTKLYVSQFGRMIEEIKQQSPDVLMIPDAHYFLDKAIYGNLNLMRRGLNINDNHVVHPYSNNQNLRQWTTALGQEGYKFQVPMPERVYFSELDNPQHRGGWGRWIENSDKPSFAERNNIPYPVAYIGTGYYEICAAYQRVVEKTGRDGVYFKPIFSAGGFSLAKVENLEELTAHYQSLERTGALKLFDKEISVEMQAEVRNVVGFASFQYSGSEITTPGGVSLQLMNGNSWVGNVFNTDETRRLALQARPIFSQIKKAYKREGRILGSGGFDLSRINGSVSSDMDRLELLEHNGDRVVGADPAITLTQALGVSGNSFMIRKTGDPRSELVTCWNALKRDDLAYDPQTKRGVIPLLWMPESGFLVTIGKDEHDIRSMTDAALDLAAKNGYIENNE